MKKLINKIIAWFKLFRFLVWEFRWYLFTVAVGIGLTIFAYWIKYQVAVSNLPDWFKFALLK